MDSPAAVFVISLVVLWLSVQAGIYLRHRRQELQTEVREDLLILLTATLTLLALIIGFTFSMAVGEYDRRRNSEQMEANAISTEYVRVSLLPELDASTARDLVKKYVHQRISFYTARNRRELQGVDSATARLQKDLWSLVQSSGANKPDPITSLVISGMNDVFSAQTVAQAVWSYRVPLEAWILMGVIAVCGNLLLGYTACANRTIAARFVILPLILSIAFFLVADLDNPRHGIISINPQNLSKLAQSM